MPDSKKLEQLNENNISSWDGDGKSGKVEGVVVVVHGEDECQVYKKRWLMLILFVCYSLSNAFQWIQYSVITGIVTEYYGITAENVDMTSLIYEILYIPFIFPATYLLDAKGLRITIILGSLGTCVGSWIKALVSSPNNFWWVFVGQSTVALCNIFTLGIPPHLAALWFGPDQVSTATSMGVFGNQVGIALGFLLPPMIVKNGTAEEIGQSLGTLHYGVGVLTTIIFIAVLIFFKDQPPKPPSHAQAAVRSSENESYFGSMKRLLSNKGYLVLMLSYGMNVGVFYAVSTVLSTFILKYWDGYDEDVGRIGLSIVLSGMVGSVIGGLILDKTKKFKETTLVLYVLSFAGMVAYTFVLPYGDNLVYLYITTAVLGFFMTGYLPVGFEFAAELTYPESEGTSSGLLNASVQIFGIILTPLSRALFNSWGDMGANLLLSGILLLGVGMTALIKPNLRRMAAQNDHITNP